MHIYIYLLRCYICHDALPAVLLLCCLYSVISSVISSHLYIVLCCVAVCCVILLLVMYAACDIYILIAFLMSLLLLLLQCSANSGPLSNFFIFLEFQHPSGILAAQYGACHYFCGLRDNQCSYFFCL